VFPSHTELHEATPSTCSIGYATLQPLPDVVGTAGDSRRGYGPRLTQH
jgi:hypothetical protein